MSKPWDKVTTPHPAAPWAGALLSLGVFASDLLFPQMGAAVLYVGVVALFSWLNAGGYALFLSAVCSALICLPPLFSIAWSEEWALRSVLTMLVLWVTAFLFQRSGRVLRRLDVALEKAPIGLLVTDREGRIVRANSHIHSLFGYSRRELVGRTVEMLVPERFRQEHLVLRNNFLNDPQARRMGVSLSIYGTEKDGTEIPLQLAVNLAQTKDDFLVLVALADDTERTRIEDVIQSQNRDLRMMLHVISHDLKEPLRAIEGFSSLVQSRYGEQLDDKGRDFLQRIVAATGRMRHLLDDISELARARQTQPGGSVDGEVIVGEALERLRAKIEQTNARVSIVGKLPSLRVNKTWAVQAIYNLLLNALKFTRDGLSPQIEISSYAPEENGSSGIGLMVRDRGPGVSEADTERLFELFQRAVGREVEGTGAGLAIVRTVAERHGGRAWARPREGGGSEFVITFQQ